MSATSSFSCLNIPEFFHNCHRLGVGLAGWKIGSSEWPRAGVEGGGKREEGRVRELLASSTAILWQLSSEVRIPVKGSEQ